MPSSAPTIIDISRAGATCLTAQTDATSAVSRNPGFPVAAVVLEAWRERRDRVTSRPQTASGWIAATDGKRHSLPLPLHWKPLPDQRLQLHGGWLAAVEDRLDDVRGKQGKAEDVPDIGGVQVLGLGKLVDGGVAADSASPSSGRRGRAP